MRRLSLLALGLALASTASAAEITVSAAASLRDAFTEIAADYQKRYPEAFVKLNTAASGTLLQQLLKGAPVDVLATADEETMNRAVEANAIVPATRKTFARNSLVLITPKDRPLRPATTRALTQQHVRRVAIGNPDSVPAGRYAKAALQKQGLFDKLQADNKFVHTTNVRQALDYVSRGEADAGFVYRTDALTAAGKVAIIASVPTVEPVSYPVGVSATAAQPAEAKRFADYLQSNAARAILKKYGFSKP